MTESRSAAPHFQRSIPSESAAGKEVISEILAYLGEMQWGEHEVFSVHLAVEEALVNAIKHGNGNDPSKQVHILLEAASDFLRIEITDEGAGFDPSEVPDPTDDENLEMPSGRGLMLMRNFMTSITFNERGNQVVMEKRL